ncbi:polysaccharide deacetylase family protein [Marivirga tractuosa]|nr:polysaccharide deacetylase family protein [Marivirga tractuosa]
MTLCANFSLYKDSKSPHISSKSVESELNQFIYRKGIGHKNDLYMNKDDLKELAEVKFFHLGNHTKSHYFLSSLSYEEQLTEIESGFQDLVDLDLPISKVFAAPFGNYDSVNEDTFKILRSNSYEVLLLTNGRQNLKLDVRKSAGKIKVYNRYLPK